MRARRITYVQPWPRYRPPGIRRKIFLTTSLDVAGAQQLAQSGGQAALRNRPWRSTRSTAGAKSRSRWSALNRRRNFSIDRFSLLDSYETRDRNLREPE